MKKLSEEEIRQALAGLPDWSLDADGQLAREIKFPTYKDGLVFASVVGYLADRMDHHPDLSIYYQRVRVAVSTHSAGGLTTLDFDFATRVQALL